MKDKTSIFLVACSAIFISGCGDNSQVNAPASSEAKPAATKTAGASDQSGLAAAPISYSEHVGAVFAAACADCHIKDSKGGFSMETFAKLMAGGEDGPVIVPGKPDESKLLKLIESGEMPPKDKGQPLLDDEKAGIREWIEKGAAFDGPDKDTKTVEYVRPPDEGVGGPGGSGGGRGGSSRGGGERGGRSGGGNWNPVEQFDKNGDKKLSKEEMPERMQDRFAEMDADKDGGVTAEEFRAAMQARSGAGRGGREGGRRPEGSVGESGGGDAKEGERQQRPPVEK